MPILLIPVILITLITGVYFRHEIGQQFNLSITADDAEYNPWNLLVLRKEPEISPPVTTQPTPKEQPVLPSTVTKKPSSSTVAPPVKSIQASPTFSLDTAITEGPTEGQLYTSSQKITLRWTGSMTPADPKKRITYETMVSGLDATWIATSSTYRTITLPSRTMSYTFYVRAQSGDMTDLTPASRSFRASISSYAGKMNLISVKAQGPSGQRYSLITIKPALSTGETIPLTGWTIRGLASSHTIGQGVATFHPNTAPYSVAPITVSRGDVVYISGARSPFGNTTAFRPNICTGYLKQYYSFPLAVSSICPADKPSQFDLQGFETPCQLFLTKNVKASSCTVPDYSQNIGVVRDSSCVSYIQSHYTYDGCFNLHSQDANFNKNEWQIYANRDFILKTYDTIDLIDPNGFIVSTLTIKP